MIDLGQDHPNYVSSSILSKKIKKYHDDCAELLPFLKASTNLIEIDTDQELDKSLEEVYKNVEPLVIHIRPGSSVELRNEMVEKLSKEHGFVNLDVQKCMTGENDRGTTIGIQLRKLVE